MTSGTMLVPSSAVDAEGAGLSGSIPQLTLPQEPDVSSLLARSKHPDQLLTQIGGVINCLVHYQINDQ